jgi:chromosome partitioning protein
VGKTSLVHHLAWMMAEHGLGVIAGDLDPQANLTANFLDDDQLEALWPAGKTLATPGATVYGSLAPLIRGVGDIVDPHVVQVTDRLGLLPGDLALSKFEDELANQWPHCLDGKERAFRVVSAFWRLLTVAAWQAEADVVLLDVGPNLGAINRSALIAADHVVIPLAPDLFSVQGLQDLGPTLRSWRREWQDRLPRKPVFALKPADGAFGGHQAAVRAAGVDFAGLADRILEAIGRPGLHRG